MTATTGAVDDNVESVRQHLQREVDQRRHRDAAITWLGRIGVILAICALWELVSGWLVEPFWISSPTAVIKQLIEWIADGTIVHNTIATLQAMIGGLLLGTAVGIMIGFGLGMTNRTAAVFEPLIMGLYAVPRLAFAPLLVLWFGIGLDSKIALTGFMVFFMVFYNTYKGVREQRGSELIDICRVLGGTRLQITRSVILPGAATWILAGFQMAVPYSMMGAIVAEIVASNRGLGHLLVTSSAQFNLNGAFAAIVVIGLIGMILNMLVTYTDKRFGLQHGAGMPSP